MVANIWYKKFWSKEEAEKQEYAMVTTIKASSLEDCYCKMQAENWSPKGEARDLIRSLGLSHTSMSIGDVIEDALTRKRYIVARAGFDEIDSFPTEIDR